jgi:hypothetical protein
MTQSSHVDGSITIRRLHGSDAGALADLVQLDSARIPASPVLGAEREGRLIAALSLESGQLVADPFIGTAEATELLRLRAAQLRGLPRKRRFRRARGALPASPPGAGGRLIDLRRSGATGWARIT